MEVWKTHYFQSLVDFVCSGARDDRLNTKRLAAVMNGAGEEEILRVHEESVFYLFSCAEPEDRMTLAHRSLLFITDLLLARRGAEVAAGEEPHDLEPVVSAALQAVPLEDFSSANKFETVLQYMDSGIALFDEAGTLRFLNVQLARFLGVPRRFLIGKTLLRLLFYAGLDRLTRRFMVQVLREIQAYRRFQGEYTDAEGKILRVGITQSEELGGDYLVSVRDVSEYKQIEQTALQNDKLAMLGKIAASIAHEIRNPLTSIRGFIQLLGPHLKEIGKEEYVRIILSEIDRANEIIYEFLNASKPSVPMKQTVLVDLLLKETILLSESEANMKGCELHCEIFDPFLAVAIDVKQIKQVLLNMIKNAMDAIQGTSVERKGRIDVSARREGPYAVISIRDNGKGMDRTTLGRLFDPFFTTKEDGTGLGLSVSYRIINNHGGSIRVDSKPGEGTEFMIYLPHADLKE